LPRGYVLTRAVGVFGQPMAEFVLSYMLAHERQHASRAAAQKDKRWDDRLPGSLLGRRVLIAGCGDIGQAVARFLAPFGCVLTGVARTARRIDPFETIGTLGELADLAAAADYVVNLLPDSAPTRDLFDLGLFRRFKPGAVFINAGRGSAVVERDLVLAMEAGHLAQAVLDVCREEPPHPGSPLWNRDGILLTGHTAAPSTPAALVRLFTDNLDRFRAGAPLRGRVEWPAA
jgi:phosphoglycerate dehydrogenase-like enzyme